MIFFTLYPPVYIREDKGNLVLRHAVSEIQRNGLSAAFHLVVRARK